MLNWLKIKNLALIAHSQVDFEPGFNVITGETGAGKSVLLGTINLLLGARADKNIIRTGEDFCEICGSISLSPSNLDIIRPILDEASIPYDENTNELQIRRNISKNNTRNLVNDTPVMLQTLKSIGSKLIDVHAASEQQSLFSTAYQLELVDCYAHLNDKLALCKKYYDELRKTRELRDATFKEMPSAVEVEHLRLSLDEISRAELEPDEDRLLAARHKIAANAKEIIEQATISEQILTENEDSITDRLAAVYRNLQGIADNDAEHGDTMLALCTQISDQLQELRHVIQSYRSRVELDEREFTELENRMSLIQRLKRRYGPELENVFEFKNNAEQRLQIFENATQKRCEFEALERSIIDCLQNAAGNLSSARKAATVKMRKKILEKMNKLGFNDCDMDIVFTDVEPTANGMDRIEFMFSANPGESLRPLREIASSGEISRVMLSLKTVLAEADTIPILVFDEIDVNIGGKTAHHVGRELMALGKNHQILCISHLAQVAVYSGNHYKVEKEVINEHTYSRISRLNKEKRINELARMLGGGNAAETHAAEMAIEAEKS